MKKNKIEGVKPFNDFFFKSCYHQQLIAGIASFGIDRDFTKVKLSRLNNFNSLSGATSSSIAQAFRIISIIFSFIPVIFFRSPCGLIPPEDMYGIEFEIDELGIFDWKTVGDIIDSVEEKLNEKE